MATASVVPATTPATTASAVTPLDPATEAAVDKTLEAELLHNARVIQHPTFGAVKLARPTHAQERQIAEARRKQFQADMRDPDVLSRDQLEALAIEKGMWSPEMTDKIAELTREVGEYMGLLDAIGFEDVDALLGAYQQTVSALLAEFAEPASDEATPETLPEVLAERQEARGAITRYFDLDGTPDPKDRRRIAELAPSTKVDDLVDEANQLRAQVTMLEALVAKRKQRDALIQRQARLFIDSIESRADRAEELARLYVCTTNAQTGAHLWPTPEAIWHAEPGAVDELLMEWHYFVHGVTDEYKAVLQKYGFLSRLTDTRDSSGDSRDQPPSNSDGASPESAQTSSSGPSA